MITKLAPTLMIQGTASNVGKSVLTAGLCRLFRNRGIRVAPFKAQNMALNAAVTPDGREIGRAQAVQAAAARIDPRVEMNPILLKPEGGQVSQVIVMGRSIGRMHVREYYQKRETLRQVIHDALLTLRREYDFVLIEGAGSPAEINLKAQDISNMFVAQLAEAPVILVGDIDRGGVFASLYGTLELLETPERNHIIGLIINKFCGDLSLLKPGLKMLEQRTDKKVLGVVPMISNLGLAEEDSVGLYDRQAHFSKSSHLNIAVIHYPHMANYDDFLPLERAPRTEVIYTEDIAQLSQSDLVILPGSKSTVADLQWIRDRGLDDYLTQRAANGGAIFGICGGCQMLGFEILDPSRVESSQARTHALGLLPLRTLYGSEKNTSQVVFEAASLDGLLGYEIHQGKIEIVKPESALFRLKYRGMRSVDIPEGAVVGSVRGTMIHGLFENADLLIDMLNGLWEPKGGQFLATDEVQQIANTKDPYECLARTLEDSLEINQLYQHISQN